MIESGYYLAANIEEIAKRSEFPIATTEFGDGPRLMCNVPGAAGFPFAPDAFKWAKPEGDYYIVLFRPDDPLAQDHK